MIVSTLREPVARNIKIRWKKCQLTLFLFLQLYPDSNDESGEFEITLAQMGEVSVTLFHVSHLTKFDGFPICWLSAAVFVYICTSIFHRFHICFSHEAMARIILSGLAQLLVYSTVWLQIGTIIGPWSLHSQLWPMREQSDVYGSYTCANDGNINVSQLNLRFWQVIWPGFTNLWSYTVCAFHCCSDVPSSSRPVNSTGYLLICTGHSENSAV